MPTKTDNKCSAKNPSICKNHGWVKRPTTGAEASAALQEAQVKTQTVAGRSQFIKSEQIVNNAQKVFNSTPEGQEKLKQRIAIVKKMGGATVPLKADLAEAKYTRAVEEGNFQIEGVKQNLFIKKMPKVGSVEGQKLVKELFKGSTKTPEQLTGKTVEKSEWNELIDARKKEVASIAEFRYRKSFANRLTADLKESNLRKKKISGKNDEYEIKKDNGNVIAKVALNPDGSLKQATVATSSDGRTSTYTNGTDFRAWVEIRSKSAFPLPEWV